MKTGGRAHAGRRRAAPGVAAFRSSFAAVVAALALFFQLAVVPYHQALSAPIGPATDVAAVAAELHALFGAQAALCVQADDQGAPAAPAGDCDDHCPMCRLAAESAAPDLPALSERLDAARRTLGAAPVAGAVPPAPASWRRARAPPFA